MMGAFVTNFHVRNSSRDAVDEALSQAGAEEFRITDSKQNWVSFYEEQASQDENRIKQLAEELSSQLGAACVAFMVHDSDIACYWLYDQGNMLDQYNSIPDYFDDDISAAEKRKVQGKADVFMRYCQKGVTRKQIEEVLRSDVTFAEDIISKLAEFLGIDPDRALQDYRDDDDDDSGGGPRLLRAFGGDDDEEDNDDGDTAGGVGSMVQKMQEKYAHLLSPHQVKTTEQGNALAQAAAAGDLAEINRLVQAGADVNAPGMLSMESLGGGALPAMGQLPQVTATPLWAAASRGHAEAVKRLIELGANAKELHPLFGSALHAATQKGSPETVKVLLEAGVPADILNAQGMTARATLQPIRNQIEMTMKMFQSMPQLKNQAGKLFEQMAGSKFPTAGWAKCEELLEKAGG
jgi:hypothetical protein